VAPTQAVILPIWGRKDADRGAVRDAADRVRRMLLDAGLRVEVDWSEEKQIGWKHNEWTLKGVPVRIELGPRDVTDEQAVLVRRDDPNPRPEKKAVPWSGLASALSETLASIQSNLYERAAALRTAKTTSVETFDELRAIVEGPRGFISAHWCGSAACEATVKEQTGATIRCLPQNAPQEDGRCIVDGQPSTARVLFARAY
jgi:prolyl-tRNA synthetase